MAYCRPNGSELFERGVCAINPKFPKLPVAAVVGFRGYETLHLQMVFWPPHRNHFPNGPPGLDETRA